MEAVNRNANSREIVAITVQENATGMMINTKNNASSSQQSTRTSCPHRPVAFTSLWQFCSVLHGCVHLP
jgi:hypothetical protein